MQGTLFKNKVQSSSGSCLLAILKCSSATDQSSNCQELISAFPPHFYICSVGCINVNFRFQSLFILNSKRFASCNRLIQLFSLGYKEKKITGDFTSAESRFHFREFFAFICFQLFLSLEADHKEILMLYILQILSNIWRMTKKITSLTKGCIISTRFNFTRSQYT